MNIQSIFKAFLALLGVAALATAAVPAAAQTAQPSTGGTYSYQTAPAIYVEITNLFVSPSAPSAGQPTVVKLTIRNGGSGTVAKVPWVIHWYTANQTLGQGEILNLAPGAIVEVSANWTPPAGSQTLQGYVDPTGKTFNNTAPASSKFRQIAVSVAQTSTKPTTTTTATQVLETKILDGNLAKNAGARSNSIIDGGSTPCSLENFFSASQDGIYPPGWIYGINCVALPAGGRVAHESYINFTLKNGWKIKGFSIVQQSVYGVGANWQWAQVPTIGSTNPYMKMSVWANSGANVRVDVQVTIEGPAGTNPYQ
ncbi:MAG TPA: CARDB domain-containing protein [Solimonas sp.]|nr:CARDB domain-containing protein [Solimonas sp.]